MAKYPPSKKLVDDILLPKLEISLLALSKTVQDTYVHHYKQELGTDPFP